MSSRKRSPKRVPFSDASPPPTQNSPPPSSSPSPARAPPQRKSAQKANALLSMADFTNIEHKSPSPRRQKSTRRTVKRPREDEDLYDDSDDSSSSSEPGEYPPDPEELEGVTREEIRQAMEVLNRMDAAKRLRENATPSSSSSSPAPSSSSSFPPTGKHPFLNMRDVTHPAAPFQIVGHASTVSMNPPPSTSPETDGKALPPVVHTSFAKVPQPHWETLSKASDFRKIINYPSLTDTQIKNAQKNLFVPLACFLPLADSTGVPPSSPFSSPSEEESLFSQLARQMQADNPSFTLQKRKAELKNTPQFFRWEQVILAFIGGLLPMMCYGRPERLSDYSAFIVSVIAEHSRNNENDWPVFLRYIEETRRRALTGADGHSLMGSSPPADQILQSSLFQSIRIDYASPNKTKFLEDFVHPSVLKVSTPTPRPPDFPSSPSTSVNPSPQPSKTTKNSAFPPPGITEAQWNDLSRAPKFRTAFCRNALIQHCATPCPRGFPHLTVKEVLALL